MSFFTLKNGVLHAENVALTTLAAQYGTPAYVYSRAALTAALKEATGRKGKPLFLPLRQALTGQDHGPEMAALLPMIGKDAALERLHAASA